VFNNIKFSIKLTIIAFKIINNRNLFINKDTVIPCRFLRFFCFIIPSKKNNNISKFAQDLGVIFIKLGQTLSTRHDILGKEIANKFSNLQDQVSPFSGDIAIQIIEDSLNIKIKNAFKEFNSKAIASASISQVHFAVDKNDTKIAIKVLRPNIAVQIKKEIKMLYWIAGFLSKFSYFDRIKPNEIVKEIESSLIQEIDLRFEASAASEMKENSLNDKDLYIPKIFFNSFIIIGINVLLICVYFLINNG